MTQIEQIKAEIDRQINAYGGVITDAVRTLTRIKDFINSLTAEQPSKEFKGEFDDYLVHGDIRNPNFDGPFGYDDIRKTAIHFANWQKEKTINKACEWLRRHIDVDDKVKMVDGEPEVRSFIDKNLHRIEVADQIVNDFKKAMEG